MKDKIVENFERQQSAFVTSSLMLDDGGADEVMLGIICKYMHILPKK